MKRAIFATTVAALAAIFAAAAFAAPPAGNTLIISHVVKGCHTWSLNGAKPAVNQVVKLRAGQSLTIRNNDVMPHQLVKTAGGLVVMKLLVPGPVGMSTGMMKAPYPAGMMGHMSSVLRVTFPKSGVYSLKTVAGEDYMSGMKTIGEDNVLRVRVVVG